MSDSTSDSTIEISPLVHADLARVLEIEARCFPVPWSLAMFSLELSRQRSICLAARARGTLVGYLVCSRYDTVWHLMNVSVEPRERRRGVAGVLIAALFEAVADPVARYTLEVRPSNAGALALYLGLGFRVAGARKRYYQDNGEDAVIMWRTPATLAGRLDDVPGAESLRAT